MKMPPNTPPGKQLAFLIHDVARLLRRRLDQATQEIGLTSAQWRVLASVARCQSLDLDPLNQAELADMLDIEPITLSRQIDRLAKAELIERRADPSDRRAHRLHLTDKALPMVAAFRQTGAKIMGEALDGVDDDEVTAIIGALDRIQSNLTGKPANVVRFGEAGSAKKTSEKRGVS
jgi:MarR family transcriptional regulator, transcriptional regulator for hemolysin